MKLNKELKILIVAENASDMLGGEAVLPLHYFRFLSIRGLTTYLLVHERVKKELEASLPEYSEKIVYVKDLYLQKLLMKVSNVFPRRISDHTFIIILKFLTGIRQRKIIKSMVKKNLVNVIHQPTPVSPKEPSLIYNVDAPVIIGPMNGGMSYPVGFGFMESRFEKIFIQLIRKMSSLANHIFPGKRKASLLLVSNARTFKALPSSTTKNIKIMAENGVDLSLWETAITEKKSSTIPEFTYMGRLVYWKGVEYLLDAFSNLLKKRQARLTIIGDGVEYTKLKKKAEQLNLASNVNFTGFLPQLECSKILSNSRALILPSLYECGGAVVLEAMAASTAVITLDWGGPSDYVNSECGILISPKSPEYVVSKLEDFMVLLSDNPEIASKMGCAGLERVKELYDWDKKVDFMLENYVEVMS